MNRLKDFFESPREPDATDDFYEVGYRHGWYTVSRATATEIERCLDALPQPRWIMFRDLSGSRHRIRASYIHRVSENTAAQRAADRQFNRARKLEDKQDRLPWEDDD